MKRPSQDKDYNLWVLLLQTRNILFKARDRELRPYGISATQAAVLSVIRALGAGVTPAKIARRLFREPHMISYILNRMERDGLLRKAKDLDRKNMIRVSLTEKGKQAYYLSTKRESIRQAISALSEEEYQQLWPCLEKLRSKSFGTLGMDASLFLPPPA